MYFLRAKSVSYSLLAPIQKLHWRSKPNVSGAPLPAVGLLGWEASVRLGPLIPGEGPLQL